MSASACWRKQRDVGHPGEGVEHRPPVRERDLAETARRALVEQERVVRVVAARGDRLEFSAAEEVAGEELQRQRTVDVHRALELRQAADDVLRAFEVRVALEALGRDDLAEQADDALALRRHLHLVDRGVEQVAAVLATGAAHVVDGARAVELGAE